MCIVVLTLLFITVVLLLLLLFLQLFILYCLPLCCIFFCGQTAISLFHPPPCTRSCQKIVLYFSVFLRNLFIYPYINYIPLCLISTCCASVVGSIVLYVCLVCYLYMCIVLYCIGYEYTQCFEIVT